MTLWTPDRLSGPESLDDLGLSVDLVHRSLFSAATDAQLCSDLDSPTAFGFMMWTRANRYVREELRPNDWSISNSNLILRTIHPSGTFAITAVSASGSVGDVTGEVRARNPKGEAVKRMIDRNGTIPLLYGMPEIDAFGDSAGKELPTWFLLYNVTRKAIHSELSYPIDMSGSFVNRWQWRLVNAPLQIEVPGMDDGDAESGPDFPIEER